MLPIAGESVGSQLICCIDTSSQTLHNLASYSFESLYNQLDGDLESLDSLLSPHIHWLGQQMGVQLGEHFVAAPPLTTQCLYVPRGEISKFRVAITFSTYRCHYVAIATMLFLFTFMSLDVA